MFTSDNGHSGPMTPSIRDGDWVVVEPKIGGSMIVEVTEASGTRFSGVRVEPEDTQIGQINDGDDLDLSIELGQAFPAGSTVEFAEKHAFKVYRPLPRGHSSKI